MVGEVFPGKQERLLLSEGRWIYRKTLSHTVEKGSSVPVVHKIKMTCQIQDP